jgi:hypothetical protein
MRRCEKPNQSEGSEAKRDPGADQKNKRMGRCVDEAVQLSADWQVRELSCA